MISVRNRKDIELVVSQVTTDFVNKESALSQVEEQIDRLLKVRQYRHNGDEDLEILRNLSLYRELESTISNLPDWSSEPVSTNILERTLGKFNSLINKLTSRFSKVKSEASQIPQNDITIAKVITKKKSASLAQEDRKLDRLSAELQSRIKLEAARKKAIAEHSFAKSRAAIISLKPLVEPPVPQEEEQLDTNLVIEPTIPQEEIEKVVYKSAWLLDGNADDSFGKLNGTIATPNHTSWLPSSCEFAQGPGGSQCFKSDGKNFIALPVNSLNFEGDYSISFRIFIPSTINKGGITILSSFDNQAKHDDYYGWFINYSNNTINIAMGMNYWDSPNFTFTELSVRDRWVHVVATRKKSTRTRIWVDADLSIETAYPEDPKYTQDNLAYIGASYYSLTSPNYSLNTPGIMLSSIQTWDGYELDKETISELFGGQPVGKFKKIINNFLKR